MIAVDSLTRSIQVSLGGAVATNQASWAATYLTGESQHATATGNTNGASAVTVVPAPTGVGYSVNQLLSLSLWNKDTAQIVVTVTYVDTAGTNHILQSLALQTNESLTYEDKSGWSGLDANGNTKVASNNVNVSTALSMASVASSQASNATASNAAQSTSISSISQVASTALLGSSQASSAHAALVNETTISSAVSRLKTSFGW
jgi:hypothetical protein